MAVRTIGVNGDGARDMNHPARAMRGSRPWVIAALWAVARVWVGWQFLSASLEKIGAPVWTGAHAGMALSGFLAFATSPPMIEGPHPNVLAPYAWTATHLFLPHAAVLSYLVSAGEFFVGAALILGLGTRLAAVGGLFLNAQYMLAGSAGINVPMFAIEMSIAWAGITAGLIGLDAVALPYLKGLYVQYRRRVAREPQRLVA